MSDPVTSFKALQANSPFLFILYYRGAWCHFCTSYIKSLNTILPAITRLGGSPLIITAEDMSRLPSVRSQSGYQGAAISDPEHLIAAFLREQGVLDVATTPEREGIYSFGVAEPAVLVMTRDWEVLFRWAIVPEEMKLGSAEDRPLLLDVWRDLKGKLSRA